MGVLPMWPRDKKSGRGSVRTRLEAHATREHLSYFLVLLHVPRKPRCHLRHHFPKLIGAFFDPLPRFFHARRTNFILAARDRRLRRLQSSGANRNVVRSTGGCRPSASALANARTANRLRYAP